MLRKPWVENEEAFYHVITWGNQGQNICESPADYQYLQLFTSHKTPYDCSMNAFVLMSNHVQIVMDVCTCRGE